MFRVYLTVLAFLIFVNIANAQTYSPWRQRLSSSGCSSLTNGQPSDLCLQQSTPAMYVCNNSGGACTSPSQWQLVTPFYLSGSTVSTVGNYNLQFGTGGIGTLTSNSGMNFDANNDGIYEISIDSLGNISLPGLGAATTGTNFVCLDTSGHLVKSTSACSGT